MSLFRTTILFLALIELLSIFAWALPIFNTACFFVILVMVLFLSLKNLAYGLFAVFAELIIGSYGYLFSLNLANGSTIISIRLGLFIVVMLALAVNILKNGLANYWQTLKAFKFFKYYLWLSAVVAWGFAWGIIRGNNFGNVFLDFNNWLFFLYLLPLVSIHQDRRFWFVFKSVVSAALIWLILKTLILLYIFSHQFIWALPEVYQWVRDTRVGEITQFNGNFYRIFIQSQIYALLGFFILLPLTKKFRVIGYNSMIIACLSVVMISFSRSFWVGLVAGLFIYFVLTIYSLLVIRYSLLEKIKNSVALFLKPIIIFVFSLALICVIAYAPPKISADLSQVFANRATQVGAAGNSRLNMLKPLGQVIANHPLIGSGFGATVTYKSADPRVTAATAGASGEFTTYAFEWAYLDLLLKVGLGGLVIYLLLIFKLLQALWQRVKLQTPNLELKIGSKFKIPNSKFQIQSLSVGLFAALTALLAVNVFTPYLNHPLGIGFILIVSVWLDFIQKKEIE